MPRHAEPNANTLLGDLLRPTLGKDTALAQNSQTVVGHPGWQPDLLITAPGRSAVVIEAEYLPAANVEEEAKERLGFEVTTHPLPIEAAIALRYPNGVSDAVDLRAAVKAARFSYCVFTVAEYEKTPERQVKKTARFPERGWLEGDLSDLTDLIRLVSLPQLPVDKAADAMESGINRVERILEGLESARPSINKRIAKLLGMDNVPQTRRMAGAILSNALVFHERIAGIHGDIEPLSEVCGPEVANPKAATLDAWAAILDINYYPIFDTARSILKILPARDAAGILHTLEYTVGEVETTGVENSHDLTGRVFQRLIADRKYLATFYTLPASAALLARLAVAKLEGVDWSDAAAIGKLRIGDFACGTGALLSAVYDRIAARHEQAGGNLERLHPAMMEEVLYGCDVMPAAVHITGSTLAGAQPKVGFGQSRLYTMPYGRLSDGSLAIGSLEFLNSEVQITLSNFSDPSTRTGSAGDEKAGQVVAEIKDSTFDLVIMNPPFTRATNHGGAHATVVNPAFAAFDASKADMDAMGKRLNHFGRDTCYHGNAGIASAFVALADKKLKPGGVLALVLPLVASAGLSWQKFRQLLAHGYTDLDVVSIAAGGTSDISFSADTGLGEYLVIARKCLTPEKEEIVIRSTSLVGRPAGFEQAGEVAKGIINAGSVRGLDDGPYGGTAVSAGDARLGEIIVEKAKINTLGVDFRLFNAVRIQDYSIAQTAYALSQSKLRLPSSPRSLPLPVSRLNTIGKLGLVSRDINGPAPRGPFTTTAPSQTATYPALWNHDAQKETRIICEPDAQLVVRQGLENKADEVWATASFAHHNVEFRYNAQPLGVAITEFPSIGGRAWPNVIFDDNRFPYAYAVWGNSTLGILMHWWCASRQDAGRGAVSVRAAEFLPVLDLRALNDAQLDTAREIFEEFRDKALLPAYLADADPNRALLDQRVVCDLLGFEEAVYQGVRRLAAKWCAEPSVNGGKARPKAARLIV